MNNQEQEKNSHDDNQAKRDKDQTSDSSSASELQTNSTQEVRKDNEEEEITIKINDLNDIPTDEQDTIDETSEQKPATPTDSTEDPPVQSTAPENDKPLEAVVIPEEDTTKFTDDYFELVPQQEQRDSSLIRKLQAEVEKKKNEAEDGFNRLVRLQAEFENFKKRNYKEKQEFKKYCLESLILELLPNLDNLERGIQSAEAASDMESVIEGIKMIHRNLFNCLNKFGLKGIETDEKTFNPAEHEAMMIVDTTEHKNNEIIEELQKGYFLHDRVIRPALVSVAKHIAAVKDDDDEPELQIDEAIQEIAHKLKSKEISDEAQQDAPQEDQESNDSRDDEEEDSNGSE